MDLGSGFHKFPDTHGDWLAPLILSCEEVKQLGRNHVANGRSHLMELGGVPFKSFTLNAQTFTHWPSSLEVLYHLPGTLIRD